MKRVCVWLNFAVIFFVFICIVPMFAEAATQCTIEKNDRSIVLSNGLCRIVWDKTDEGWIAQYQAKVHTGWETVAQDDLESDAAYGVCFKDGKKQDYGYASGPGDFYKALPPTSIKPEVLKNTEDEIQIRWSFGILDHDNKKWPVKSVYRIRRGDRHIHEEVRFSAGQDRLVRFQRGWAVLDIDVSIFETIVNSVSHSGWMKDTASFMAIVDPGALGPTETGHGGGVVRRCQGFEVRDGGYYSSTGEDTWYSVLHRVPHFLEDIGWVDAGRVKHYTISHDLMMWPGILYEREAIDYLRRVRPLQKLPLRYSWKEFLDKQVEAFKYGPQYRFDDHGDWGHTEMGWIFGNQPEETYFIKDEQSLDWGGNFDAWIALSFREYGIKYQDVWATERANKILNGIKGQLWQVEDPETICDGAFWMFRPKTKEEYQEWKKLPASDLVSFHVYRPFTQDPEIGKVQTCYVKYPHLWTHDTGKIGALMCDIYDRTKDPAFLERAKKAAEFLFRIQKPDGNLTAGRIDVNGNVVYESNMSCNACAVMVWSRLFEITKEGRYKEAAIRCAKFSIDKWLNGKDWEIYGGEWDVPGNITTSGVSNVAWGFSLLYRATGYKPALDAVRRSADYLCVQETLFDTEYGRYAPKAFWKGADAKTTGGIVQSSQVEGYGAVLTNQPSNPYGLYMAWKVTGDKMYFDSVVALLVWQMYMQSDNPQDYRFHGGMGEGLQWTTDELNGYGCAFHGESIGFSWTLHQLMKEGVLE